MPKRRIVVGVDGSAGSISALRWALDEARLRETSVELVHAWHLPALTLAAPYAAPWISGDLEPQEAQVLEDALELLGGESGDVEVDSTLVNGMVVKALIDISEDADLLVVGSRGRGGFKGLLLGSVSQQCAMHARCPVVIVH